MNTKSITLTLVIPAYNEERYLFHCLKSIKNQTIMPYEVIVVDNNSLDNTSKIAEKFNFVRVIKEEKQGIVFARNRGFNSVKSDLIGRIDADTVLSKDWVQKSLEIFNNNHDISAVTGKTHFYDSHFKNLTQLIHSFVYYFIQSKIARTEILWGSNMLLRTNTWNYIKDYCNETNEVHEDIDLSLCLKKAGYNILRSNKLKAQVSLRRGEFSFSSTRNYLKNWPNSYFKHQLYIQGLLIYIIVLLILLMGLPLFLWHFLFHKSDA